MLIRKLIGLLIFVVTVSANAQQHLSLSPEKPKPGDVVTITYEPAGDIANTILPIDALVYQMTSKGTKVDDISFQKNSTKYTSTLTIDTGANFIYFSFSSDKKFDNNFNNGYFINIYENGQPRKGSYYSQSQFYQYYGTSVGMDKNNDKAMSALEKEFETYPEQRKNYQAAFLRLMTQVDKEKAQTLIQKEIESQLRNGLKSEADYDNVSIYYNMLKLPEQAKYFANLKKEKNPNGKWVVTDLWSKFYAEANPEKKSQLLNEIIEKLGSDVATDDWKKNILPGYKLQIAMAYATAKQWDGFKKVVAESGAEKAQIASLYNNVAWEMQKTSENMKLAEEISNYATSFAKENMNNPSGPKPDYLSMKQWKDNNQFTYGMYGDTYAMIMYRLGKYKQGFPYAKDAAIVINKGKSADENNTYALLAEKVLPAKQAKKEIEQFVKDGKSTAEMQDILKRIYIKEKKSDAGFDNYIAGLQQETYKNMLQELRKSMLNETSPSFALLDMSGSKMNISDLKGKVVVVDFWATWCGPCKASFPGMQKMVTKYKDNPDVKFIFIDTWERVDNKEKNAAEFIANNKYTFHVLMDNDSKVVDQFKVDGIPTKFVIDKNGVIRFKAVGFDGSDDKLISELTAMIDMASSQPKAF